MYVYTDFFQVTTAKLTTDNEQHQQPIAASDRNTHSYIECRNTRRQQTNQPIILL